MRLFPRAFSYWLPLVIATSGLFLFAYWAVQQEYRITFNDPQIQMAEDAATALDASATPAEIIPQNVPAVDIRASLAPWLAIYNAEGTPLAASGELEGAPPTLPVGVFDTSTWHAYAEEGFAYALPSGEDRFTWQPRTDVRQAIVLVHAENGDFVASGRNMREVERQESVLTRGGALLWSSTELGTLVVILILLALGWI
ncbi:MAG: hypothetical protein ACREGR_03770 [Minisyncoccia bacterium]